MEPLPIFKGLIKSLFFTHNTLISVLYAIISSTDSRHLRCCDQDGSIINKGAQFRHGLDSQYGDIMFVMKNDFWKDMKGLHYGNKTISDHAAAGHVHKHDFLEYVGQNNSETIDKWLAYDAQLYEMRRPTPPGLTLGNGRECRGDSWQFSWCNIQLHIGENVNLTHVRRVYAPAWLLHDNLTLANIEASDGGLNTTLLRLLVTNQLPFFPHGNHAPNPLDGLFRLYGPPNANDHYHTIAKSRHKITLDPLANCTYGHITPTTEGYSQYIPTHRSAKHSSSTVFLDERAFHDAELLYIAELIHHNMTELPATEAATVRKHLHFPPPSQYRSVQIR